MNHVRLHGDPFGDGASASSLRHFLRSAQEQGLRPALSLSAVRPRAPRDGERVVSLTDGVRRWETATSLSQSEVDWLLAASDVAAVATAPLVVFAAAPERADIVSSAGLEWPRACAVLAARCDSTTQDLLARVRAEFRWAGHERQPGAEPEAALRPWLELPASAPRCFVHFSDDVFACGTDLVVSTFVTEFADQQLRLRLVVSGIPEEELEGLRALAGEYRERIEILRGPLLPEHLQDAGAVVQPSRRATWTRTLVYALASGRPVVTTRFSRLAAVTARPGVVLEVSGRCVHEDAARGAHHEPATDSLVRAWSASLAEQAPSRLGQRARRHVIEELVSGRPFAAPPPVEPAGARRPRIVLEASWFDLSATAELAVATARTLIARDQVDVRLAPTGAFRRDLAWLREAAPELVSRLHRQPGRADLWLSVGWSARGCRPSCGRWVVQPDWEYGAMPSEAPPATVDGVDLVMVQDEHAHELLVASGCPTESVQLVLHGAGARASTVAAASADAAPSLVAVVEILEQWTFEAAGVGATSSRCERVVALPTPEAGQVVTAEASTSPVASVELVRS